MAEIHHVCFGRDHRLFDDWKITFDGQSEASVGQRRDHFHDGSAGREQVPDGDASWAHASGILSKVLNLPNGSTQGCFSALACVAQPDAFQTCFAGLVAIVAWRTRRGDGRGQARSRDRWQDGAAQPDRRRGWGLCIRSVCGERVRCRWPGRLCREIERNHRDSWALRLVDIRARSSHIDAMGTQKAIAEQSSTAKRTMFGVERKPRDAA